MSALDDVCTYLDPESGKWWASEWCDKARAELVQLRAAASERDGMRDSLRAWAALWSHICQRLGADADTLPNEANFDSMIMEIAELKAHQAALYSALAQATGYELREGFDAHEAIRQLVEIIEALEHDLSANDFNLKQRIEAQAAQLEQARETMMKLSGDGENCTWYTLAHARLDDHEGDWMERADKCLEVIRAWLAANPPQERQP